MNRERIIVVTGFPRCGTTLMMRLLHTRGIPVLADNHTSFEFDMATRLPKDSAWLESAGGKAVKILEPGVFIPPRGQPYDWIWMSRNPYEQARSNVKFLRQVLRVPADSAYRKKLERCIRQETPGLQKQLAGYPDSRFIEVSFEHLLEDPKRELARVNSAFDLSVDCEVAAVEVINRSPNCLDGFLELRYL